MQSDVPSWADWIPAPAEAPSSEYRFAWYYDVDAILTAGDLQGELEAADPMANPLVASLVPAFKWLELGEVGIAEPIVGPAAEAGEGEEVDPGAVPADSGLLVGNVEVYLGSFDGSALQDAVDAGAFSETDSAGVYAHDEKDAVVTWDDGSVVVAPTEEGVDTVVGTVDGDRTRWHDVDGDYEWLLGTGGQGEFAVVGLNESTTEDWGNDGDFTDYSAFNGSRGFAQSASTNDDGALGDATTAVVYVSEDDVDRERLESNLGADADDRIVDQEGPRVAIRGSYDGTLERGDERTATPTPEPATETPTPDGGSSDGSEDGGGDGGDADGTSGEVPGMGIVAALASLAGGVYVLARGRDGEGEQ